ncbi:acyl-CoA carboxylase epsilon subunit [Streptomyces sp. HPF1205]|uniref:acyl-CoA carboxylase epsilon subunit n=1 Tax=Streptomyces sp. HPF1205 TaxID=2873262 RepID=UPI001CED1E48|nr:acyl-CoA carboxylase epsilon subunit [Streptomyces sp. HPF1205]
MPAPEQTAAADAGALRVRRGTAGAEELAALMAVLGLLRAEPAAAQAPAGPGARPLAAWRRPERQAAYADPRAWQRGARP